MLLFVPVGMSSAQTINADEPSCKDGQENKLSFFSTWENIVSELNIQ